MGAAVYDGRRIARNGEMVQKEILDFGFWILDWKA